MMCSPTAPKHLKGKHWPLGQLLASSGKCLPGEYRQRCVFNTNQIIAKFCYYSQSTDDTG